MIVCWFMVYQNLFLHQVIYVSDFNNTAVSTSDFVYVVESSEFNGNAVVLSIDVAF